MVVLRQAGGEFVQLGGRALDILCVLASAEGAVVSKDELMGRVWGGVVVEENNLQVHISALRKAFDKNREGDAAASAQNSSGRSSERR